MVTLPSGESGILDPDAESLFELMNVPVEGSMMGPGKKIEADSKGFQMVCGLRQGMGYTCTIVLSSPDHLLVNPTSRTAEYILGGEEGENLRRLFSPNQGSGLHFFSGDGKLEIHGVVGAMPGAFQLIYRD